MDQREERRKGENRAWASERPGEPAQENAWKCIPGSKSAPRVKPRGEERPTGKPRSREREAGWEDRGRPTRNTKKEEDGGDEKRRDDRNCDQGVGDIIRVEKPTPPCHREIIPDSSN